MNDKQKLQKVTSQVDKLQSRVKGMVEKSQLLADNITSAKTSTKKAFYKKKLKRNNNDLFELLLALDNYNKLKEHYTQELNELPEEES